MVEDVACIRGALGRPREDAADAVHLPTLCDIQLSVSY